MKTSLFAVALASLALAGGCATGGNGVVPIIDVAITSPSDTNASALYPTEPVTVTATVSKSATTTVTWSLSGTNCTGSQCGTLTPTTPAPTPATASYVAPATPVSGVTITAALTPADPSKTTGTLPITVVDVTSDVAPATLSVGKGLIQTFTAVAVPDIAATQTFTWSCTAGGAPCGANNLVQDPNVSGLAYYTANDTCTTTGCVQISAAAKLASPTACSGTNAGNCTIATASVVPSRVSGTYAFRFSGYDNSHNAVAVAGTFTASNGTITSGTEDELTSSGPASHPITGGTYTPISSSDPNSNNAGTLTLTTGAFPDKFQVVLDGAGDIEMIESDNNGTGSGMAQMSADPTQVFSKSHIFAFGFAGAHSVTSLSRAGYAGLITMNPNLSVSAGLIDVNDNGNDVNTICGAPPCAVTGSYGSIGNGSWLLTLSTSSTTMKFHFYVASGGTGKTAPLTLYPISIDGGAIPAVSGTMVLQDSSPTYNNAAFKGTSVTALTGTAPTATATCTAPPCTNVSLTLGTTDGNGNFSGQFDQNNGGAILSDQFPPSSGTNNYTYAASSSNNGRYTFNLLGDPTASTVVAPLPFVLYASGANRGFLLDQSSPSVMTGTMNPQGKTVIGFPGSTLPSTFAAATTSTGNSAVDAIAANLLLTFVNTGACTSECVNGTQYDAANVSIGGAPLAGTYSMQSAGNGTIALGTAPSTQNFVIYALDTSGCTSTTNPVCATLDFLMMDVDKTNPNASIIFARQ